MKCGRRRISPVKTLLMPLAMLLLIVSCTINCCTSRSNKIATSYRVNYKTVGEIPAPENFKRIPGNSFPRWLRGVRLKTDNTVYLFNGERKENQTAQFAVLDIPVGKRDLQQCADAVIRLRSEYLRDNHLESAIVFHAVDGTQIDYTSWRNGYRFILKNGRLMKASAKPDNSNATFEKYLELVFTYCSTLSLEKELKPVNINDITPGDVFIRGGSPGHAVIVMDVAADSSGNRKFLLAQSYMPAQDIHILRNPSFGGGMTPWFSIPAGEKLVTPEWVFRKSELKRF
jgi:hypothetical protein